QQYLTVLQALAQADLARKTLQRNEEFLRLAQAGYGVGLATLMDVRQAEVARGQAEVGLLRAQTAVNVEKLRLFEQMGVTPPIDVATVQLTDSFSVQAPQWQLSDPLTMAEEHDPALKFLRARAGAAGWSVRAATSNYGPSLSVSAGWSGFMRLRRALRTVGLQDTNLRAAREQLQLATERYRVGSGTFFELLDAQVAALRAESDAVNATYDYHKALAALEAALGRSLR